MKGLGLALWLSRYSMMALLRRRGCPRSDADRDRRRSRQMLRRAGKGYVLGVTGTHRFHSWGEATRLTARSLRRGPCGAVRSSRIQFGSWLGGWSGGLRLSVQRREELRWKQHRAMLKGALDRRIRLAGRAMNVHLVQAFGSLTAPEGDGAATSDHHKEAGGAAVRAG
ncbi:MAG: hypothetical protein C4303_10275 [candidate division GAL15 bacterium]